MRDFLVKTLLIYVLIMGYPTLSQILLIFGIGAWKGIFDIHLIIAILVIPAGFIISAAMLLSQKKRASAKQYVLAFSINALALIPSIILTSKIRSYAYYQAGIRATPIIKATEKYTNENDAPPETLEDLIPKYITKIPARIPHLEIKDVPTWQLTADASTGILNWDEFIYRPDQNYPTQNSWERLGNWAYYHE